MWWEAVAQGCTWFLLNPSCHMGLAVCPPAPPSLSPSSAALNLLLFKEERMRASCFPCPEHLAFPMGDTEDMGGGGGVHEQPSPRAPGCLPGDMMTGCCTCLFGNQAKCLLGNQRSG
ncbi:unnamed protein product [Rangifer tarandus platyrhynchus]|uniref:Uncharacterized protein n=1 Tax=Rangifer tarandus platyrhynchus TaxID=3082113 RepID=A0AC59YIJ4_RANTA